MPGKPKRILVKGNEAICRGAVAAGCQCYFGYPITPQNDIPEYLSKVMPKLGRVFVQAESEIAAANMLLGAAACGVRAMTSSSSPGISLKQEAISYMAGSQLPAVIVNMSRGGPGLGDIGPSQGDYYQAVKGGGHGDYRQLVLAPGTVQEAYDLVIKAFDLAFAYRNPVMVLGDAIIAQMMEPVAVREVEAPPASEDLGWNLMGKGSRPPRVLKSLYLEDSALAGHNALLREKYASMEKEVLYESFMVNDAELIVVAFGSIGRIAKSTVRGLREKGHKVGLLRPITLFPFPSAVLGALAEQRKLFLTIEHNLGQMVDDVRLAVRKHADSFFYGHLPGNLPTPDDFEQPILQVMGVAR
ncbi:MAG TPA: 3-methyl-2-oxobutanoate dehydrogenase subunit VorB [Desulfonatronum sp.]|nr:3-methyl-2-oxobutanoate dehydrogenase subunit VorB [Desulfonatronum sp.]